MAQATISFDADVVVEQPPEFLSNIRRLLLRMPEEIGPLTARVKPDHNDVVAEIAWRGEVFAKLSPPRPGTGGVMIATWSAGGSPSGEWLPRHHEWRSAMEQLLAALRYHSNSILAAQSDRIRNAAALLQILERLGQRPTTAAAQ